MRLASFVTNVLLQRQIKIIKPGIVYSDILYLIIYTYNVFFRPKITLFGR